MSLPAEMAIDEVKPTVGFHWFSRVCVRKIITTVALSIFAVFCVGILLLRGYVVAASADQVVDHTERACVGAGSGGSYVLWL
jgi:hypothetical protein